jgi:hypothetical protein
MRMVFILGVYEWEWFPISRGTQFYSLFEGYIYAKKIQSHVCAGDEIESLKRG